MLNCSMVQDLIPLVVDDVCSAESREAALEHIKTCETCKKIYENAQILPTFEISAEEKVIQKSVKKGFRKIHKRWIASIVCILLLVPISMLTKAEIQGHGIAFSNIHEIFIANEFLKDLKKGDYDAAFDHFYLDLKKTEWLERWFDEEKLANMDADARETFYECASMLIEAGGLQDYEFLSIEEQDKCYYLRYNICVNDQIQNFVIIVTDEGITDIIADGSFLDDPMGRLAFWSEQLWEDYSGCYFDPDTKQYVYYK